MGSTRLNGDRLSWRPLAATAFRPFNASAFYPFTVPRIQGQGFVWDPDASSIDSMRLVGPNLSSKPNASMVTRPLARTRSGVLSAGTAPTTSSPRPP